MRPTPKCPYCNWPVVDLEPGRARVDGDVTMCIFFKCQRPLIWHGVYDRGILFAWKLTADELAALPSERMTELRALVCRWRVENDA